MASERTLVTVSSAGRPSTIVRNAPRSADGRSPNLGRPVHFSGRSALALGMIVANALQFERGRLCAHYDFRRSG